MEKGEQTITNDVTDIHLLSIIRRQKVHRFSCHCQHVYIWIVVRCRCRTRCRNACLVAFCLRYIQWLIYVSKLTSVHYTWLQEVFIPFVLCTQCNFPLDTCKREDKCEEWEIFCTCKHIQWILFTELFFIQLKFHYIKCARAGNGSYNKMCCFFHDMVCRKKINTPRCVINHSIWLKRKCCKGKWKKNTFRPKRKKISFANVFSGSTYNSVE